ncbi:hypothetical protein Cgig2_030159 [Carnegiea gigantea]|uniref:Uncharacterized protein n=1 Tax=Carnegiea gigantea TaxID=171969 RepID=A0A9Q1KA70_9CARY|nr:hypothetical protein Cgig2_030159 [Carnegiea gigantea]
MEPLPTLNRAYYLIQQAEKQRQESDAMSVKFEAEACADPISKKNLAKGRQVEGLYKLEANQAQGYQVQQDIKESPDIPQEINHDRTGSGNTQALTQQEERSGVPSPSPAVPEDPAVPQVLTEKPVTVPMSTPVPDRRQRSSLRSSPGSSYSGSPSLGSLSTTPRAIRLSPRPPRASPHAFPNDAFVMEDSATEIKENKAEGGSVKGVGVANVVQNV